MGCQIPAFVKSRSSIRDFHQMFSLFPSYSQQRFLEPDNACRLVRADFAENTATVSLFWPRAPGKVALQAGQTAAPARFRQSRCRQGQPQRADRGKSPPTAPRVAGACHGAGHRAVAARRSYRRRIWPSREPGRLFAQGRVGARLRLGLARRLAPRSGRES